MGFRSRLRARGKARWAVDGTLGRQRRPRLWRGAGPQGEGRTGGPRSSSSSRPCSLGSWHVRRLFDKYRYFTNERLTYTPRLPSSAEGWCPAGSHLLSCTPFEERLLTTSPLGVAYLWSFSLERFSLHK